MEWFWSEIRRLDAFGINTRIQGSIPAELILVWHEKQPLRKTVTLILDARRVFNQNAGCWEMRFLPYPYIYHSIHIYLFQLCGSGCGERNGLFQPDGTNIPFRVEFSEAIYSHPIDMANFIKKLFVPRSCIYYNTSTIFSRGRACLWNRSRKALPNVAHISCHLLRLGNVSICVHRKIIYPGVPISFPSGYSRNSCPGRLRISAKRKLKHVNPEKQINGQVANGEERSQNN